MATCIIVNRCIHSPSNIGPSYAEAYCSTHGLQAVANSKCCTQGIIDEAVTELYGLVAACKVVINEADKKDIVMVGNNTFILNQATMCAALQVYLDTLTLRPLGKVIRVEYRQGPLIAAFEVLVESPTAAEIKVKLKEKSDG